MSGGADLNEPFKDRATLILLLVFNFAITFVVYKVLVTDSNFDQVALAKIQWDGMPQGSIAQQMAELRGQRERWYLLPGFAVAVSTLALSAFFYVVLRLAGASPAFLKVFSVVCWCFVIYRVLGGILTILALLLRGPANFFPAPPEAWSPTSVAHLVSRSAVDHHRHKRRHSPVFRSRSRSKGSVTLELPLVTFWQLTEVFHDRSVGRFAGQFIKTHDSLAFRESRTAH